MKRIALVLFLIILCFPLMADTGHFILRHVVNVDKECYFEFWSPKTNQMITEASVEANTKTIFSTLIIIYNTRISLKNINVSFTSLTNSEDNSYCDYTMEVLVPNSSEHLVEVTEDKDGHGSGSVDLLKSVTTYEKYSSDMWNTDEVADFAITVSSESATSGDYEATLKCVFESN